MPKCRDNLRRKRRINAKEKRISKWCENYFFTVVFPGSRGILSGGYNLFPHPWRKKKHQHKQL